MPRPFFPEFASSNGPQQALQDDMCGPCVFLAGAVPGPDASGAIAAGVTDVWVAVWDARDQSFAGAINVNELSATLGGTDADDLRAAVGRVELAIDSLNRLVVVWEAILDGLTEQQTLARILQFSPPQGGAATGTFAYLTPTFFPFETFTNSLGDPEPSTIRPNVSMTEDAFCVAAQVTSAAPPVFGDGGGAQESPFTGNIFAITTTTAVTDVSALLELTNLTVNVSAGGCNSVPFSLVLLATFRNAAPATTVSALGFDVVGLTEGALLCNADVPPGTVGATLTVPATAPDYNDLKLAPGESVEVLFELSPEKPRPFSFFVNASGVAAAAD